MNSLKANSSTTVVVGMSGGVDSSVTAALLKEAGYRVVGLFMKNWEELDANGVCEASKEFEDVVRVCQALDIPYHSVEFISEYRDRVFAHFLREYEAGYTPNPDVLCNREIKFDAFYEKAMDLGADFLATGHYARARNENGRARLFKGLDPLKDQSYFLHAIQGAKLGRVLFPVGDLPKSEVRKIAARLDLSTKEKKDSTGICFIGERNFQPFLAQYLKPRPGEFRLLSTGRPVGTHAGAQFYTLGQRKGLGLGGEGEPWFVVKKDVARNVVYVERGENHPALYADELVARELTWIAGEPPAGSGRDLRVTAKARYRQSDQDATLALERDPVTGEPVARVRFDVPQRALTPGQSVVFYLGDECLGGGVIRELGTTYAERGFSVSAMTGALDSAKAASVTPTSTSALEA